MFFELACLILLQNPVQSLPLPITQPANGYTIMGEFKFESNVKPQSVEVSLEVDDGQVVSRTMSGPNGEFRFDRLRDGRYYIVVEGEKFWNIRERVVVEQGSLDFVRFSFTLKTRPGMTRNAAGEIVSVAALRRPPPPKDAQKEYDRFHEEQRKGNATKAVEHLKKALEIAPDYYEANLQLGIAQNRAGKPDEAVRFLAKAVELDPGSPAARTALGKVYFEKQEFQKAADTLVELTKLGIADSELYTLLGATFYKLNQFEQAEEYLRHAIALSPETAGPAHLQLYNVYMRSNRLPMALEQLETYLKQFPNAPDRASLEQQAIKLRQILKR